MKGPVRALTLGIALGAIAGSTACLPIFWNPFGEWWHGRHGRKHRREVREASKAGCCARCGATATRLYFDQLTRSYYCKDRFTCEHVRQLQSML